MTMYLALLIEPFLTLRSSGSEIPNLAGFFFFNFQEGCSEVEELVSVCFFGFVVLSRFSVAEILRCVELLWSRLFRAGWFSGESWVWRSEGEMRWGRELMRGNPELQWRNGVRRGKRRVIAG